MAYSTSQPPSLTTEAPLGAAGQVWYHSSADATAAVDTAGFITNGASLGMRVGDIVNHQDSGTGVVTVHRVVTVNATTGAVDLSDGVVIGSATNTD